MSFYLSTWKVILLWWTITQSGTRDPSDFFVWYRGQVTAESMFLMAAAIAYRYSHLSKGNDAQHWMKACLKWVIGTVHIRYICLSLLVILEVEDITRKCTFGHITKKKGEGGYHDTPSPALHFSNLNNVWTRKCF